MKATNSMKCENCGATLALRADGTKRCTYCQSTYEVDKRPEDISTEMDANDAQRQWEDMKNGGGASQVNQTPANNANINPGCVIGLFVGIFALIVLIAFFKNVGQGTARYSDSIQPIDTSKIFAQSQPSPLSETEQECLKKLKSLNVNKALFKKLCNDSSIVTADRALQETYIKDKILPAYKPLNGLHAHIEYNQIGYFIFLTTQHIADKAMYINSLTFKIKGKRIRYLPSFTIDSVKHQIIEYSDEVIFSDKISMLYKLATADKVTVNFNSKKRSEQTILPKEQQAALKRQLQIYKGLLLGYAKQ